MRSVRTFLTGAVVAATLVLAAACGSDLTTQPDSTPARTFAPSPIGASRDYVAPSQYYTTVHFWIYPRSDLYVQIGPHYLYMPAGSVCEPSISGYGIATWNLPCLSSFKPIYVTATASMQNGHPLVEFDTHLRFRPSKYNEYDVMLYLRDDNANSLTKIFWCPDGAGSTCVDEAKLDPTLQLKTRWDSRGAYVYRKIQHFSGFNSTGGDGCDPSDPTCGGGFQ